MRGPRNGRMAGKRRVPAPALVARSLCYCLAIRGGILRFHTKSRLSSFVHLHKYFHGFFSPPFARKYQANRQKSAELDRRFPAGRPVLIVNGMRSIKHWEKTNEV